MTRESGWTVDTAMEHIEALLEAMDRRYQERFDAQEKALDLATDQRQRNLTWGLSLLALILSAIAIYFAVRA